MTNNFQEKLAALQAHLDKVEPDNDSALLEKVAKGLGPALYNIDASKVACSDKEELDRVVKSYVVKKLGMDAEKGQEAVQAVCAKYTERFKLRGVFYYLVCKHLGAEDHYA
ncbi:DUF2853 family protein [Lewinella sp. 4G2]|uniref:DUF2853 family protein n=1 Tax=Lewinella sp. 4G2 TaxID=1803372 RepID=UPI0007B48CCE|nr:DUF2853 family protein [Lewinella sp. 4G2]OAV43550.1 hypothetical protein A3850_003140 [Lewinella sp. 4G2]